MREENAAMGGVPRKAPADPQLLLHNQAKPKRRKKTWIIMLVAVVLLAVGGTVGYLYYQQHLLNEQEKAWLAQETFYAGVSVEGVDLSGLSRDDAKAVLAPKVAELTAAMKIAAEYEGKTWELSDTALVFDVDKALDEAYGIGRAGDRQERLADIRGLQEMPRDVGVSVSCDEKLYNAWVELIAFDVEVAAQDASVEAFTPDEAEKFKYKESVQGLAMDRAALKATVDQAFADRTSAQVKLVTSVVEPAVTLDQVKAKTQLISEYTTQTTTNSNRNNNIRLAVGSFHGRELKSGEVFSFNGSTGPRTEARGYRPAPAIKQGSILVDEPGGGVCQASGTLYNTVLKCDLKIVERYHHTWPSDYVPPGLDATVNYGTADFRFENNKDSSIYMAMSFQGTTLTIRLYGQPLPDGVTIKCSSETVRTIAPAAPKQVVDATLAPGQTKTEVTARNGYVVNAYKTYYDKDGNKIKTDKMYTDTYVAVQGVVKVGPTATPEPPATLTPPTTPAP